MKSNLNKLEELGKLRFPAGAEFEKFVNSRAAFSVQRMLQNLADNYPDVDTSRIASLYRTFCEERERALKSLGDIADDQFFDNSRPEYLFQILGDMLFINEKAGGVQYTDKTYRDFLLKVRTAYLGGSTAENISKSLSDIIGIPVFIKQLYLEARKTNSPYTIADTHRLVADIFLTDASNPEMQHLSVIIQDLYYFTALIRPAHSLYDTRLIWEDSMSLVGCDTEGFAMDPNGNTYRYAYSNLPNKVYSLYRLAEVPDDSEIIGESWVSGTVSSVDISAGVITLTDGSELVVSSVSVFYKYFEDEGSIHRIEVDDVSPGTQVWFYGNEAPGSFNFYNTPASVTDNWYSQFDPTVIESSSFQNSVIRLRDDSGKAIQDKSCPLALQVGDDGNLLIPLYEDLRDNCEYPIPRLYHQIFSTPSVIPPSSGEGYQDVPSYLQVSNDTNAYQIERYPLSGKEGGLATVNEITLYIDNQRVESGIAGVDAWEGLITLNFLPPAGSKVRFDYYYQDVYPSLTEESFGVGTGSVTVDGNVPAGFSVIPSDKPVVYFQWPFKPSNYRAGIFESGVPESYNDLNFNEDLSQTEGAVYASPETDYSYMGNAMSYQLNEYPLLDSKGDLATKNDIAVFVDGVETSDALDFIRPLLGHAQLTFIPPLGSVITFQYYYQAKRRDYPFMTDSDQHLADMVYGVNSPHTLVTDPIPFTSAYANVSKLTIPAMYGYRYNAFDLNHSSVWNSLDTFKLNDYQLPSIRGSYAGTLSKFNKYRMTQSGEYLYDTDKYLELNEAYIFNGLEPLTQLRGGVPPFYRSFTSWANYVYQTYIQPSDSTSVDGVDGVFDMPASVTVDSIPSGQVEYVPIPEYFNKNRIKTLAGTEEAVTVTGDENVVLSPFCEDRGFDLNLNYKEEYYPNRELRLNDYRDYVDRLSFGYMSGYLTSVVGTDIVKSRDENWSDLQIGDEFTIVASGGVQTYMVAEVLGHNQVRLSSIPPNPSGTYKYVVPSKISGKFMAIQSSDLLKSVDQNWLRLRKGTLFTVNLNGDSYEFTVVSILNYNTVRIDRKFPLAGGRYAYQVTSMYVQKNDVTLNNVVRSKHMDIQDILPFYQGFSGATYSPWVLDWSFPDPDLDPYPRNDGDWFSGATGEGPAPGPAPLLTSSIDDQGSQKYHLLSESASDKMVKFRNWDQDLVVVNMGLMQDPFLEAMDDNAESIRVLYWNVDDQDFEEYAFRGSLMITSESKGIVSASSYPYALIKLRDYNDLDGLNDSQYELTNTVIRQLLPDNTVDIIAIEEFVRIPS